MKKFTYLLAVAAVFTACNSGNNGNTVTGTVEGAADGDTVYLETVEGRQFVKLDSAVIKDGTFTFKGTQDTAVNRYISYKAEGKDGAAIDFFLENGKIKINLSQENNSATGTANNDAYQEIRAQINGLNKQMMSIYESMSDTTLTDEQREAKGKEMENLENSMISAIKAGINKNITWHQSRHSYATTICLSNGVPIETLSKMMGHTSIRSTQIYAKITAEKVSNDMERLSKQIESMEQFICQTI